MPEPGQGTLPGRLWGSMATRNGGVGGSADLEVHETALHTTMMTWTPATTDPTPAMTCTPTMMDLGHPP